MNPRNTRKFLSEEQPVIAPDLLGQLCWFFASFRGFKSGIIFCTISAPVFALSFRRPVANQRLTIRNCTIYQTTGRRDYRTTRLRSFLASSPCPSSRGPVVSPWAFDYQTPTQTKNQLHLKFRMIKELHSHTHRRKPLGRSW